jgi:hypothetical protein
MARVYPELGLGELSPLDKCVPELAPDPEDVPGVCHDASAAKPSTAESVINSEECAREGSNLLQKLARELWLASCVEALELLDDECLVSRRFLHRSARMQSD